MRKTVLLVALAFLFVVAACKKKEPVSPPASSPETPVATTTASAAAAQDAGDLAGISQGASIARAAGSIEAGAGAYRVIDEDATAGWTSAEGKATAQSIAIQLAERCAIDTHPPKDVLVRANTVKNALTTAGLGSTKPVATNDTALGRAANRRVEVAR